MKVTPLNAPAPVPGHITEHQQKAAKRDSAIKAFMGADKKAPEAPKQETPVQNPSKVSPEEMGAIKPSGQTQSNEPAKAAEEAPTAPVADAKKEETPLSAQYAQLARKEKALRAQAQQLKAREDALKASEAPKAAPQETIDPSKYIPIEEFRKNPWKYAQDAGVTYDQLTQEALNAPSHESVQMMRTIEELKSEIKSLRVGSEEVKKTFEQNQQDQYKQALNQIRSEAKQLIYTNEEFEACKATNSVEDVVELIEKTFKEDGVLLSVEDAAKQIEDYLAEEAYKLSQLKKIQKRLKPQEQDAPKATEANKNEQPQTKTLSNAMSASRQLSARERALAAAQHGPAWREKV